MKSIADLEFVLPDHPFVFEFRHASWEREHLEDLFTRTGWSVAATHVDNRPARWSRRKDPWTKLEGGWSDMGINSRFTYIRLHGTKGQYTGSYEGTRDGLILSQMIASAIEANKPVWVVFNNTDSVERSGTLRIPSAIRDAILFWHHGNNSVPNLWNIFRKVCAQERPRTKPALMQKWYWEYKAITKRCAIKNLL
jgi:hypothetical protein